MSPNLQVVVFLLTDKCYHSGVRVCMCELARDAPSTALQVSISKIIYCVRAFFLSFFFLFLLLLFVFTVHSSEGDFVFTMHRWCNGSFCTFHSGSYWMMIMDMLLLCWPQDDQAVVIMMIVSLIRLVVGSGDHFSSPFPPHTQLLLLLTLPMLLDCPTFAIYLLLFSVSLNDHFCIVLITWSFLVRHLTNGEVLKIVFTSQVRQLPTEGLSRRTQNLLL